MKQLKTIDRKTLRALSNEIELALHDTADKYGLHIKTGGGSFASSHGTIKLNIAIVGDDGTVVDQERSALRELYPELEERRLTIEGRRYTVTGFRARARKRPFRITDESGKHYVASRRTLDASWDERYAGG